MNEHAPQKHVGHLIKILNTRIESYMNMEAADIGLTGTQTHTLHYLCLHAGEKLTQKGLEKTFKLNHATLSGILSRLESKEFISYSVCETDKRIKYIHPTQKAFDVDAIMKEKINLCEKILSHDIGDDELLVVREILTKMIMNITATEEEK